MALVRMVDRDAILVQLSGQPVQRCTVGCVQPDYQARYQRALVKVVGAVVDLYGKLDYI